MIEDGALVFPKDYVLPPVCLKTGAVDDLAPIQTISLTWRPLFSAILHTLIPILHVLDLPSLRSDGKFEYYLTLEVARKRRRSLNRNRGLLVTAVACFAGMPLYPVGFLGVGALAGLCCLISYALCSASTDHFLYPRKITKTHIHLLGVLPDVQQKIVELSD